MVRRRAAIHPADGGIAQHCLQIGDLDQHPRRKAPQRLVKGDLEGKGPFAMPEIDQHRDRPPIQVHAQEMQPPVLESRSEEHTSELQSLMRISYAVFCLKKKIK